MHPSPSCTSAREVQVVVGPAPDAGCRCGHPHLAHEHYRRGTDCALCVCARFRVAPAVPDARPWWARLTRRTAT